MPSINQNYLAWNEMHSWRKDGDEWNDQADFCGQPYDAWKQALIAEFVLPYVTSKSHVLEIGPGHGRWTTLYLDRVGHVSLVDLSPACIEHCKRRFSSSSHIDYFLTDGRSLSFVDNQTIDFIWSYDVFVHIERDETGHYFKEFARILTPDGTAVIHHPNVEANDFTLLVKFGLLSLTGPLRSHVIERYFRRNGNMGRSFVSSRMIRNLATNNRLQPIVQTETWGTKKEFNCRLFHDQISVLRK